MDIIVDQEAGIAILRPDGPRLTWENSGELRAFSQEALDTMVSAVIIDLAHIEHIDSDGLGAFLTVRKNVAEDCKVLICGVDEKLESIFRLPRLDQLFPIHPDLTSAVESLSADQSAE